MKGGDGSEGVGLSLWWVAGKRQHGREKKKREIEKNREGGGGLGEERGKSKSLITRLGF